MPSIEDWVLYGGSSFDIAISIGVFILLVIFVCIFASAWYPWKHVLPAVAWTGSMALWGLPFIHQLDLTPEWLMVLAVPLLILTYLAWWPLWRDNMSGHDGAL
jgi:hypothetical protein